MLRTLAAPLALLLWFMLVLLQAVPAKAEEQSEGARLREESILLLQQRETAQAKELADQALAWAKTQFGQEHIEIAEALLLLAAFESGDDRRRAAAREATAMAERVLGPPPRTAGLFPLQSRDAGGPWCGNAAADRSRAGHRA